MLKKASDANNCENDSKPITMDMHIKIMDLQLELTVHILDNDAHVAHLLGLQ